MRRLRFISVAILAVFCVAPLRAQQATGTIRGRVTDTANQQPLSRVTVTVGNLRAMTQDDGTFFIAGVSSGADTLRARMIGYAPTARAVTVVAGQTLFVDLAMTAQAVGLTEIVVVGYGQQRAGDITGAVTNMTDADFNTGRIISPSELIQNKAAGVQVVENNEPGGGTTIRIRGTTSVNASSDPLYVVDGVPLGAGAGGGLSAGRDPLNFLNPADIENITVLRDASAAGIYGANAANGVVLISTRGGQRGPQFAYSTSYSLSRVTRVPEMMNAQQYRAAVTQYAPGSLSQLGTANTDWFDLISRSGFGQEHNLSVSGAGGAMNYRLSFGYLSQEGVIRGTNTERVSLGLNYNQRLFSDRLSIRASVRGSREQDDFTPGGALYGAYQMGPTQPVYDPTTTTGYFNWPGPTLTSADNPLEILNLATDRGTTYRSIGSFQAEYQLPWLSGLRANLDLGYDVTKAERVVFNPRAIHRQQVSNFGVFYRRTPTELNTVLNTYLNYATSLRAVPGRFDMTAGYSYSDSYADYPWYEARGLATDLLGPNGITSSATVLGRPADIQESRLISFFGRVNYNLGDRWLASVSLRRDGSSRFGTGNEWGTFPAFSLGWRVSQETFMQRFSQISDLKLRFGWARTGNQAFANYQQYTVYVGGDALTQVQFGNTFVPTIRPSAATRNIRWETTSSTNFGIDFSFMNHRISGSLDWYNKDTDDLIFFVPVPAGANLTNFATRNIGSMQNRGIELAVNSRLRDGGRRGLSWNADFTIARNSNELLTINPVFSADTLIRLQRILTGGVQGGVGTLVQVLEPGQPVYSFYVLEHRIGPDGRPVYAEGPGADTAMYVDRNGDNQINDADRRPFHDPLPKWILGHSSYLTYNRWDLRFTLRAYLGNYVYNNVASQMGASDEVTRSSPYNLHTSVLETGFETPQYLSDYYVENASFLRLDNIAIGYAFTYRGLPARAFASVQNVFTITGYSGVDPTSGLNGLDNNIYPRSRTFTTGVSVQF